jgi:transcriptional regulator with XRE-family HTH domain
VTVRERFSKNLLRERKRAGLSQEQLAFLASLHRTEIGMIERGGRLVRIDTLIKLVGALEVDVSDLLDGITWSPPAPRQGTLGVPSQDALGEKGFNKPFSQGF